MTENQRQNESREINLSAAGSHRRMEILAALKKELPVRAKRRKRNLAIIWTAPVIVLFASVAWIWAPANDSNSNIVLDVPIEEPTKDEKPEPPKLTELKPEASPQKFDLDTVVASNKPDVIEKYVVTSRPLSELSIQFEILSDAHLREVLDKTDSNYLVGLIDGKITVLSKGLSP